MSNLETTPELPPSKGGMAALAVAAAGYTVMMGGVLGLAILIHRSIGYFDFTNLLNTDSTGIGRLLAIATIPVGLFLAFQLIARIVRHSGLSVSLRAAMLLAATFLSYFIGALLLPATDQAILAPALGGGIIIGAIFDFFTEKDKTSLLWTILALLLFSVFSATLFWTGSSARDKDMRFACAQALAESRDTAIAEQQLARFYEVIAQDAQLPFLMKPWPIKPSSDTVKNYLSQFLFNEKYLFRHYALSVHAFDRDENEPLFIDQRARRAEIAGAWESALPTGANPALRSGFALNGANRYLLRLKVDRMKAADHPVELFCFFEQRYPQITEVYSQIFDNQPFKNLTALQQFNYAVLHGSRIIAEQGNSHPASLSTHPGNGRTTESPAPNRADAVSVSADGKIKAVVGRPAMGILQPLYFVCLLFGIASAFPLLLGLLSRFSARDFSLLPSVKGSLSRRIHFSYLGLLAAGFIVIGVITFSHFSRSADIAAAQVIDKRANTLLTWLKFSATNANPANDSTFQLLGPQMAQLALSLNTDADLYDANGALKYATREDLRRIGKLPATMDSGVKQLLDNGNNQADAPHTLENQTYMVRYQAVKNLNQQTVAYVGLPYATDHSGITREISNFIGMLAGIYVFLLLLAAAVTYYLSNSITNPIKSLSEKIQRFQLQDKNEKLEYQGDKTDEINHLVEEYNEMVDKLEDSKVKLVKLERESAWRDMARQIAHDIKNPLTTMKLSMQQLERVSNDPAQAAAYLKRATGRLIEQIDSLAQTASEFSMFANLDRTPKLPVVINDIVESVYDLFTEQKDAALSLDLPDERFTVNADKNHLLRVFNNLVINAIQAIPSDREGRVKVSLRRIGDSAIIRISDNGGGIPHEIRERVFEPNFTTKTSGSGLGLAICKKIIEAHDGDIRFETRDNEGTEFFVDLPIISVA